MPIISAVGRRALSVRLLLWTIYGLLTAGAATMVYPFLLMLAGSTKSSVDTPQSAVIPRFLHSDPELYRKHVEGLFNEHLLMARNVYYAQDPSFRTMSPPPTPNRAFVEAWREFLREVELPPYSYTVGYVEAPVSRGVMPHHLRAFKRELSERFGGDLARLNTAMETDFVSWNAFSRRREEFQQRSSKVLNTAWAREFDRFKQGLPRPVRYYYSIEGFFRNQYLMSQYTRDIGAYNESHGSRYESWDRVHLDRRLPAGPGRSERERQDWLEFTRTVVSLLWVRADHSAAPAYRGYLLAKYGSLAALNQSYGSGYLAVEEIPFPEACPQRGLEASDWEGFLQGWEAPDGSLHSLPAQALYLHSVEFAFRDWLRERYGGLFRLDRALGTAHRSWLEVLPPQRAWHYLDFLEQKAELRREFLTRNFLTVIDYVALHGRGIYNTVVYCVLAVLAALIVNPAAAYALSRYRPPSPAFLLLREMGLLNTFWALILPGAGERLFDLPAQGVLRLAAARALRERRNRRGRGVPHFLADHHEPQPADSRRHRPGCFHRRLLQFHHGPADLSGRGDVDVDAVAVPAAATQRRRGDLRVADRCRGADIRDLRVLSERHHARDRRSGGEMSAARGARSPT